MTQAHLKLIVTSFVILSVVGSASAQVTKNGDGYVFRLKLTKGFKLSLDVKTQSRSMHAFNSSTPMSLVITDVKGNIASIETSFGPQYLDGKSVQPIQKKRGKINDLGELQGDTKGVELEWLSPMAWPKNPVKIGDVWTNSQPFNVGLGDSTAGLVVDSTYKLRKIAKYEGVDVAEISVQMDGKGDLRVTGGGTIRIRMSDGFIYRSFVSTQITMGTGANAIKITSTTDIVRK